jgi:hypothetical protein
MSSPLTKACYHLNIARQYLELFRIECKQGAKNQAGTWVNKAVFLENDIMNALTAKSRDQYRDEIMKGDPLVFDSIFEKLLAMSLEQRETMEYVCSEVLKGETIQVEQVNQ